LIFITSKRIFRVQGEKIDNCCKEEHPADYKKWKSVSSDASKKFIKFYT
jgi:hypothetical protein